MPASFRRLIRSAGPMLRAWSTSAVREAGVAALAIVACGTAIAGAADWLVFALGLLTLAVTVVFGWEHRRLSIIRRSLEPTGSYVLSRVLISITTAVAFSSERATERGVVSLCGVLLALALVAEWVVSDLGAIACPYSENLPGIDVRNYPLLAERWVFTINTAALALLLALGTVTQSVAELPIWPLLLPGIVALLVAALVIGDALLRLKSRRSAERMLPKVLADYAPTFLLYCLTSGVGSGTIKVRWLYRGRQLDETEKKVSYTDVAATAFTLKTVAGFPPGDYSAEVFLDGQPAGTKTFRVESQ